MNDIKKPMAADYAAQGEIRVSRLEMRFEVPGIESKRIFANGRMQVRVWVIVVAVDEDGTPVPLQYFPELISTRLVRYQDGRPLAQEPYAGQPLPGWNASFMENRYAHEMPGATNSAGGSAGSAGVPVEFWVSSSDVGQLQIAAEVTVQGKVYRSNNTINPDGAKLNNSAVISAERCPGYSPELFSWKSQEVFGAWGGARLFRYDLGLYSGGQQVKLIDWETHQYGESSRWPVKFCYTGMIASPSIGRSRSFTGVMLPVQATEVDIIGFRVPAIQGDGQLTAFKGMPPVYVRSLEEPRLDPFRFQVLDEFGNAHPLSLMVDIQSSEFLLVRG
ncbi:hypothetical protein [Pseudomonas sp. NFX15]|uniref:hypothetical protein n=1 Tax=Pseudomonas sp. NFX15 TaxID=2816958 RepID=UPI003B8BD8D8